MLAFPRTRMGIQRWDNFAENNSLYQKKAEFGRIYPNSEKADMHPVTVG
jgi:hypothetical protein